MDISTLKTFIEVMRQGSFAAVAREHNIDPSSVSRSISGLEKELGVRLFQRTTRQLSPTEAGMTYFYRIEPLIEEIQQAVDSIREVSGQPKGTLRFTASVPFGLKCIVPLLPKFSTLYPDLVIDLLLTDSRLDLLTERIDLAIRLGPLKDSTLIVQKLMSTSYLVCASPDYLKKWGQINQPGDITKHNCLLFPLAGFRSRWIFKNNQGETSEIPVSGNTIISNATALQQCALAGMGLALLPRWLIKEDLEAETLIPVLQNYDVTGTDFQTAAWLVYPFRTYVPLKVRVFIDFLKEHLGEEKNYGS